MKKMGMAYLAVLLLVATVFLFGCGKEKAIDYDHFIQTIDSSPSGVAAVIDGEARKQDYLLVFVAVQNDTKDAVTVRKGDYVLRAGGVEYASDGYLSYIDLQSGSDGSDRLTTVAYDTIGRGKEKKLGVLFFCDVNGNDNFTLTFHGREIR